jgi:hypothetical protein
MLTANHTVGSVVPKATVTTAWEATMQIGVRGLFHEERTEGDKKTRHEILCGDQHIFHIQSA